MLSLWVAGLAGVEIEIAVQQAERRAIQRAGGRVPQDHPGGWRGRAVAGVQDQSCADNPANGAA